MNPLLLSSSALWSWMELNANDLTELLNLLKRKISFYFYCFFVPISAVSLDAVFSVLYFSAYYSFGITYVTLKLTTTRAPYFFRSRARDFYQVGWKKYCENLASRFLLLDKDCLGKNTEKMTHSQKAKNSKTLKIK